MDISSLAAAIAIGAGAIGPGIRNQLVLRKPMQELLHSLGIDWRLLIAQGVNFAILLAVLGRFVYRPIMKMLDDRREGVRRAIEREESAAAKLAAAEAEKEAMLADARVRSQKIIDEARQSGEEVKRKMFGEAKEEIKKMQTDAAKKLQDERVNLVTEVKSEIGTLIVDTIEKTLGDVLDERSQGKMVEQALAILREQNGSSDIEYHNPKNS